MTIDPQAQGLLDLRAQSDLPSAIREAVAP
jgi:hypothetical protein